MPEHLAEVNPFPDLQTSVDDHVDGQLRRASKERRVQRAHARADDHTGTLAPRIESRQEHR